MAHEFEGALTLNKKKAYGVVSPPENGAHFCQEGFYFTAQGALVTHPELLKDKDRARLERMVARKGAEEDARKAYLAALKAKGLTEADVAEIVATGGAPTQPANEANGAVDSIGWGKGLVNYPFFTVKKAFSEQFFVDITNADDGVIFLVKEGRISQNQAKELKNA